MHHFYIEPTPEQKAAYSALKASQGISFPFRTYTQKSETATNEIYETTLNLPSSVACMAMVCFNNRGSTLAQNSNSKEIDCTGGIGQFKCTGKIRPMMNIKQIYASAGDKMFPHSTGLLNPSAAQIKKYIENVYGKADKYSLRRFQTDKFFLPIEMGCGPMVSKDYKEKLSGYRFPDRLTSKLNLYIQFDGLDTNDLEVQTIVQGLQIATISSDGNFTTAL